MRSLGMKKTEEVTDNSGVVVSEVVQESSDEVQDAKTLSDAEIIRNNQKKQRELTKEINRKKAKDLLEQARSSHLGRLPVITKSRIQRPDPTALPPGVNAEVGFTYKWVPSFDHVGNRVPEGYTHKAHESEGFQRVKLGGEDVNGPFGTLMKIAIEDSVERSAHYTPAGSVNPDDYAAAMLEDEYESLNREHGIRALNVQRLREHGSHNSAERGYE